MHVGDRKARKARGLEWGTVVDEEAGRSREHNEAGSAPMWTWLASRLHSLWSECSPALRTDCSILFAVNTGVKRMGHPWGSRQTGRSRWIGIISCPSTGEGCVVAWEVGKEGNPRKETRPCKTKETEDGGESVGANAGGREGGRGQTGTGAGPCSLPPPPKPAHPVHDELNRVAPSPLKSSLDFFTEAAGQIKVPGEGLLQGGTFRQKKGEKFFGTQAFGRFPQNCGAKFRRMSAKRLICMKTEKSLRKFSGKWTTIFLKKTIERNRS